MATRRTVDERRADLEARKQRLVAELAALDARSKVAARKRDTRRKVIVGAAVLAHAELDADFRRRLAEVLQVAVTRDVDRALLDDFLAPAPSAPSAVDAPA